MSKKLDYRIKKLEKGPLQRFKNQNTVLKKFGEDGLRLYKAANGKKTADELVADLGLEPDFVAELISWMEDRGMIELAAVDVPEQGGEEEPEEKAKKVSPKLPKEEDEIRPAIRKAWEEPEEEEKPARKKPAVQEKEPEPEIEPEKKPEAGIPKPKSRLRDLVEQELGKDQETPVLSSRKRAARIGGEIAKGQEDEPEGISSEKPDEDEIRPAIRKAWEEPEEEEKPARKKPAVQEKEPEPEEIPESFGQEDIKPVTDEGQDISFESEEKPKKGRGEKKEEPGPEPVKPDEDDIAPVHEEEEPVPEPEQPAPEEVPQQPPEEEEIKPEEASISSLNPVEKTISDKYGDVGLKVYALIDGQKNAEEIMNDTGVSEAKLIEMLEFMEKQGIIKLEHPEQKAAAQAEEEKDKFAPLADRSTEGQFKDLNPVELPSKAKLNFVQGIELSAKLALQYGEKGKKVFDSIDSSRTDVDLSARLSIPIYEVRNIFSFLIASKAISVKSMDRNEIIRHYGEDSVAVYKKYGREGVLLYELIGKDMSIRQMANMVTKERERFADMFIFVHKVLGVDIPIDRDVIYSQLGK